MSSLKLDLSPKSTISNIANESALDAKKRVHFSVLQSESAASIESAKPFNEASNRIQETGLKVIGLISKAEPMLIEENTDEIIAQMEKGLKEYRDAKGTGHPLFITSEMSLTNYCCGDLFFLGDKKVRNTLIESQLSRIIGASKGASIAVGFPFFTQYGKQLILHALISDGKLLSIKPKEDLANNIGRNKGVEYEVRHFKPCAEGVVINIFGKDFTYEKEKRTAGNIFSDEPVVIAGKKVSMVICEEMFTGTDRIDLCSAILRKMVRQEFIKPIMESAVPHHVIEFNEDCEIFELVEKALKASDESFSLPVSLRGFSYEEIVAMNALFSERFSSFKNAFLLKEREHQKLIDQDILEKSKLYQQLKKADVVIVPNGSPSATGKIDVRKGLLNAIGVVFAKEIEEGVEKRVFYINQNGIVGTGVAYDGAFIKAVISKEGVKTTLLSAYNFGLINEDGEREPHWALPSSKEAIAKHINGHKYFSGKVQREIRFANIVPGVHQKFYQNAQYVVGSLVNYLKDLTKGLKPGEFITKGSRTNAGYFVSQSGGFDSGFTTLTITKALEKEVRAIYLKNRDIEATVQEVSDLFSLNYIKFDLDQFCARFLRQKVTNQGHPYLNLEIMLKMFDLDSTGVAEENHFEKIELLKGCLQGITSVADLIQKLNLKYQGSIDDRLDFISKLFIFHLVKTAYLRTDNNSINTENAARTLPQECGADFEVRNVHINVLTELLLEKGIDLGKFNEIDCIAILNKYGEILALNKQSDKAELAQLKKELFMMVQEKLPERLQNFEAFQLHNWAESRTGLEIENAQARIRAQLNWFIANEYALEPTSNPNADEAKQGYTTVSGDLHAGTKSFTSAHNKTEIYAEMSYFQNNGMEDNTQFYGKIKAVPAIGNTFGMPPSAELQQLAVDKEKGTAKIEQTDEDSYGMSYPELTVVGQKLFHNSENGAHFETLSSVYLSGMFKDDLMFHGHDSWTIFSKLDKVCRQWYAASFKRRSAPWQITNSDSAVDHHASNRIEFAGNENAIRFERTGLLLTLLVEKGIIQGLPLDVLHEKLLFNSDFQNKLATVLWSFKSDPDDIKTLIKQHANNPAFLNEKIKERVIASGLKTFLTLEDLKVSEPSIDPALYNNKREGIAAAPLALRARDIAGNVALVKGAIAQAYQNNKQMVIIPDIIGQDLGDNIRRVSKEQIELIKDEIARFARQLPADFAIIYGHPDFDPKTEDRSKRYFQAATLLQGFRFETFYANRISNNNDRPGPSYDNRTFLPYTKAQEAVEINGKSYFILIGDSFVPEDLSADTKVLHLSALNADDQIERVKKIGSKLEISVNAIGSSSGIRAFNGRSITDLSQIDAFKAEDQLPETSLNLDARWYADYLPGGKVTIALDGPEALYTLAVAKRSVEIKTGKPCDEKSFRERFDVVSAHYSFEKHAVDALFEAANQVVGFTLPQQDEKHPTNRYTIDTFAAIFFRNAILGDINIKAFKDIKSDDTWLLFDAKFREIIKKGEKADINEMAGYLEKSVAFRASLKETYRREVNKEISEKNLDAYCQMEIALIRKRLAEWDVSKEMLQRLKSQFYWTLSARDGGEGQVMLNNTPRYAFCASKESVVGSRGHQGGVTVTAHHSLVEMKEGVNVLAKSPLIDALFENEQKRDLGNGLTAQEVDQITDALLEHNFNVFALSIPLSKLEKYALAWEKANLDRHTIPNAPHTKGSIDQQTSIREPKDSRWLLTQVQMLKKMHEVQSQVAI